MIEENAGRVGISMCAGAMPIDSAQIEKWALFYLERYASSAENLRRVLRRRVRRAAAADPEMADPGRADPKSANREMALAADPLIDALIIRYRNVALLDDASYAASRARRGVARGHSMRRIAAGLAAKGVGPEEAAVALADLRDGEGDAELAAAAAFARRRHLGPFRREPAGTETRMRELGAFARAGFTRRTAEAVLACPDEAALAEVLDDHSR